MFEETKPDAAPAPAAAPEAPPPAAPAGPVTPPPAPPTPPAGDNWQARFAGLQRTHQQSVDAWAAEKAVFEAQIAELTGAQANLQQQLEDADTVQAAHEEAQLQVELLTAQAKRVEIIAGKHPNLLPFFNYIPVVGDDGTILTDEQIGTRIDEFAKLFGQSHEQAIQQFREGAIPTTAGERGRDGEITDAQLDALIEEHAGTPEGDKYLKIVSQRRKSG